MRRCKFPRFAAALRACAVLSPVALLMAGASAQAQVNRCMTAEGITLYTDRRCTDMGAVPDHRPAGSSSGSRRFYRGGCARNVQDLVYEVTTAIDSGDVNRLAGVYHWAGMSGRAGYAVMSRLAAVVKRPLVDIVPIPAAGPEGEDGWRTVFGMHRHFGCYWITG
jgi:hypothetical protein